MLAWTNMIAEAVSIVYALSLAGGVLLCLRSRWKICAAALGLLLVLQLQEFVFPVYMERLANAVAYGNDSAFKSAGELLATVGTVKYIIQCAAVMLLIYGLYHRLSKHSLSKLSNVQRGTQDV